jgi:hypothetical protein
MVGGYHMREKIITVSRNPVTCMSDRKNKNDILMIWKLTEKEFEKLWKLNIWEKLGEICNMNIGRFEDVEFTDGNLFIALDFLKKECLKSDIPEIRKLKSFFENCIAKKAVIYFSF